MSRGIRDIYSRSADAPKFNDDTLEVTDGLSQLIIKIDNVLFTRKGEVLGSPQMGCNLDELIFSLTLNANTIQQRINGQISAYCLPGTGNYNVQSEVKFFTSEGRNGAFVDIFVNEQRVIGALF